MDADRLLLLQALGHFSLYDYREPRAVPEDLKGAFSVVVADPPYLASTASLNSALAKKGHALGSETTFGLPSLCVCFRPPFDRSATAKRLKV